MILIRYCLLHWLENIIKIKVKKEQKVQKVQKEN